MNFIVVGLGNPGEEYKNTRHNAGRLAVESLAKKMGVTEWKEDKKNKARCADEKLGKHKIIFLLPETFMNKSGASLTALIKSKKSAENLVVIHDDLDLPLGVCKMSFGKGAGGHRGVESIIRVIKTKDFIRFRIGVSSATAKGKIKKPQGEEKVIDHILGKFKPTELEILKKINKKIAEAIEVLIERGRETAMSRFN